jgi:hypothetical protein
MPSHTFHVVQAFAEREGGIVPVEPKACPAAGSARALAARLAPTHASVIAWSRTGDRELGDWGPPAALVRTGIIPDGGRRRGRVARLPMPVWRCAVGAKRQAVLAMINQSADERVSVLSESSQMKRETVD